MSRQQGDITVLTKANSRSQSLRTTIPMSITRQFNLKEGDHLRWEIQAKESKLFVVINPINGR
jgi:bifunctional DNA-binding transcriptional regulator/antitoxin component of YhaV-PrlF toxin-antitoxin module